MIDLKVGDILVATKDHKMAMDEPHDVYYNRVGIRYKVLKVSEDSFYTKSEYQDLHQCGRREEIFNIYWRKASIELSKNIKVL